MVKWKFVNENYLNKGSQVDFQKSLHFKEIYVKYLDKNSITKGIVYSCIT